MSDEELISDLRFIANKRRKGNRFDSVEYAAADRMEQLVKDQAECVKDSAAAWDKCEARRLEVVAAEAKLAEMIQAAAIAAGNKIVELAAAANPEAGPLKLQMLRIEMEKAVQSVWADAKESK